MQPHRHRAHPPRRVWFPYFFHRPLEAELDRRMALDLRKRRKRSLELRRSFFVDRAPLADQLDEFVFLLVGYRHLLVYHR